MSSIYYSKLDYWAIGGKCSLKMEETGMAFGSCAQMKSPVTKVVPLNDWRMSAVVREAMSALLRILPVVDLVERETDRKRVKRHIRISPDCIFTKHAMLLDTEEGQMRSYSLYRLPEGISSGLRQSTIINLNYTIRVVPWFLKKDCSVENWLFSASAMVINAICPCNVRHSCYLYFLGRVCGLVSDVFCKCQRHFRHCSVTALELHFLLLVR